MSDSITRRDFVNGTLIGSGSAVLSSLAPSHSLGQNKGTAWTGYAGVGDYRDANGNTWDVISVAHRIRDGAFDDPTRLRPHDTGEVFDLVVVGGGSAGLGAAYFFQKMKSDAGQKCLILENHAMFGGEAKQNEFVVNGQRVMGPQGAWRIIPVPAESTGWMRDFYSDVNLLSTQFRYQEWDSKLGDFQFDRGCDFSLLLPPKVPSFGYFFPSSKSEPQFVRELWEGNLDKAPIPPEARRDLQESVFGSKKPLVGEGLVTGQLERWLDTMTYRDYLETQMGLHPWVTRFADPLPGCIFGLGADGISALMAYRVRFPGFHGISPGPSSGQITPQYLASHQSFPGGNSNTLRHLCKFLIPEAIAGQLTLENVHNNPIRLDALDRATNSTRIRLRSTVVRVEHLGQPDQADLVRVMYLRDGELSQIKARRVVVASGGWVNRHIVRDIPQANLSAYEQFHHSSTLVVNVALTNWRFLYKLGITGARWFDGFGYTANIRQQMLIGSYQPKLHPDAPNVLTFYVPFYSPGRPVAEQVSLGRQKLFGTSFQQYEVQIREQLANLFGPSGFDASKDVAGIVLNRWGHSLAVPEPGFIFGRNGQPPARETASKSYGRVAFAHSELEGGQYFGGAMNQARRATTELLARV
ncbi:MAG: NAD(P)-binding protein [Bryobacteraceae bacterium]